mgnify:CR=1 FL=1
MPMERDLLLKTMLDILTVATPNTLADTLRSRAMLCSAADPVAAAIVQYWDFQRGHKDIVDAGMIADIPSETPGDEMSDLEALLVEVVLDAPPKTLAKTLDRLTALDLPRAEQVAIAAVSRGKKLSNTGQ